MNRGPRNALEVALELVDADAFATDEDPGTGRVDDHVDRVTGALDFDARDAGRAVLLDDVISDELVLEEQAREVVLAAVPAGSPGLDDSDSIAGWVDLLSHWIYAFAASAASSAVPSMAPIGATITVR